MSTRSPETSQSCEPRKQDPRHGPGPGRDGRYGHPPGCGCVLAAGPPQVTRARSPARRAQAGAETTGRPGLLYTLSLPHHVAAPLQQQRGPHTDTAVHICSHTARPTHTCPHTPVHTHLLSLTPALAHFTHLARTGTHQRPPEGPGLPPTRTLNRALSAGARRPSLCDPLPPGGQVQLSRERSGRGQAPRREEPPPEALTKSQATSA